MAKLLSFCFLFAVNSLLGQGVVSVFGNSTFFRDVENTFRVGLSSEVQYDLKSNELELRRKNDLEWVIIPRQNETCKIFVINASSNDTIQVLNFSVLNLTKPSLLWAGHKENAVPSSGNYLQLQNESLIYPICYKVDSWKVTIDEEQLSGHGSYLSSEALNLIHKSLTKEIFIEVNYSSDKGKSGSLSKTYRHDNTYFNLEKFDGTFKIIDRNKKTESLFNENNPFSLVSILQNKILLNPKFISSFTCDRIIKSTNQNTLSFYLDSESDMNYKSSACLDSIDNNGNYVYPHRNSYGYDLKDISKLILFYDKKQTDNLNEFQYIGLAKKYSNSSKYEVTLVLDRSEILNPKFTTIIDNPKNELSEKLKNEKFISNLKQVCTSSFENDSTVAKGIVFHHINRYFWTYPFFAEYQHTLNQVSDYSSDYHIEYEKSIFTHNWSYEKIKSEIDSCYTYKKDPGITLVDVFGSDSLDLSGNFVQIPDEEFSYWIDFKKPEVFFIYTITNDESGKLMIEIKSLLYTQYHKGKYLPIFSLDVNEFIVFNQNEFVASILNEVKNYQKKYNELTWMNLLIDSENSSGKIFETDNNKHIIQLNEIFNLDFHDGVPLNLLRISTP